MIIKKQSFILLRAGFVRSQPLFWALFVSFCLLRLSVTLVAPIIFRCICRAYDLTNHSNWNENEKKKIKFNKHELKVNCVSHAYNFLFCWLKSNEPTSLSVYDDINFLLRHSLISGLLFFIEFYRKYWNRKWDELMQKPMKFTIYVEQALSNLHYIIIFWIAI